MDEMKKYEILKWLKADGFDIDLNDQFSGTEFIELSFNDIAELMYRYSEEQLKINSEHVDTLIKYDEQRPIFGQSILYVENHGLKEGVYKVCSSGVGWVILPDGGMDCFDEWKPKHL